jgi:hypothetical protein
MRRFETRLPSDPVSRRHMVDAIQAACRPGGGAWWTGGSLRAPGRCAAAPRAATVRRDQLPGGRKAQIQPAEGAAHLLQARTGGQVSEVDDGELAQFEY